MLRAAHERARSDDVNGIIMTQKSKGTQAAAGQSVAQSSHFLGVGILFNPALSEFLHNRNEILDYIVIIPEMFQDDRGKGSVQRFAELETWVSALDHLIQRWPVVAHNIGLSLGSAENFDEEYLQRIADWHSRCHFSWHSDHLSYSAITEPDGGVHNTGLSLPVPYDWPVLEMLVDRINQITRTIQRPFLIENNVSYIEIPEQDLDEVAFLNCLSTLTGCGLLLDLHNVYVNARNFGFNPHSFIDRLNLDRVQEIHVAGGDELAGMYTDSHAGPCPHEVWELLKHVCPLVKNLRGVTFEFHESYYPLMKSDGIRRQLDEARNILTRYH